MFRYIINKIKRSDNKAEKIYGKEQDLGSKDSAKDQERLELSKRLGEQYAPVMQKLANE